MPHADASLTAEVFRSLTAPPPAQRARQKKAAYAWCSRCGTKTETNCIPAPPVLLCGRCRKWARKLVRKKFLKDIQEKTA